tara:strand:- start:35 stop:247 length:213 start_codon:yes stop_codon:yes gene_type:complete
MKNEAYINQHGAKTSEKLEKIKIAAWEWVNDGGSWSRKAESQKLFNYRMRWEKEVERIGGVNYTFGDCLA